MEQLDHRIGAHVDKILDAVPHLSSIAGSLKDEKLTQLLQEIHEQLARGRPVCPPNYLKSLDVWSRDDPSWLELLALIREWSRTQEDEGVAPFEEPEISNIGFGILWVSLVIREYQTRTRKSLRSPSFSGFG
jgi:hypothetical protein